MAMGILMLSCVLAANPVGSEVYHINQHQLRIPISVDPAHRSEIKELILFVSADEGKTWSQQAVAGPDQDAFPVNVPKDGMYWFSPVVVNKQGRRDPVDIYAAPPAQKILIDTLKPLVRIKSAERLGEDIAVYWEIQEDHPDLSTLKLEYKTADSGMYWNCGNVEPAANGQARFRPANSGPVSLRLQIQDLAGNVGVASAEVPAAAGTQLVSVPSINPSQNSAAGSPGVQPLPAPPANSAWDIPAPKQPNSPLGGAASPAEQQQPISGSAGFTVPQPGTNPNNQVPTAPGSDSKTKLVATSEKVSGSLAVEMPSSRPNLPRGTLPPLEIINTNQVTIQYEITKKGPSGIGKVELWMTRDDGHSWDKLAENPDLNPPLRVELPGEGVYGFRLVLHSKASLMSQGKVGRSNPAPVPGDLPEIRVEVDTTPPTAQLFLPELDPKQNDCLVLSWSAADRNLSPKPITLLWAEQPTGPWQEIVKDWPNDGHYNWKLPPTIPFLVYLRLVTVDTAGNVSTAETPKPICIDLKEPEGRILGIKGSAQSP
jgi:hypothetical protein